MFPKGVTGIKPLGDQFSEIAVRVSLLNRRDPKNPEFQKRLRKWEDKAKDYVDILNEQATKWQGFSNRVEAPS